MKTMLGSFENSYFTANLKPSVLLEILLFSLSNVLISWEDYGVGTTRYFLPVCTYVPVDLYFLKSMHKCKNQVAISYIYWHQLSNFSFTQVLLLMSCRISVKLFEIFNFFAIWWSSWKILLGISLFGGSCYKRHPFFHFVPRVHQKLGWKAQGNKAKGKTKFDTFRIAAKMTNLKEKYDETRERGVPFSILLHEKVCFDMFLFHDMHLLDIILLDFI